MADQEEPEPDTTEPQSQEDSPANEVAQTSSKDDDSADQNNISHDSDKEEEKELSDHNDNSKENDDDEKTEKNEPNDDKSDKSDKSSDKKDIKKQSENKSKDKKKKEAENDKNNNNGDEFLRADVANVINKIADTIENETDLSAEQPSDDEKIDDKLPVPLSSIISKIQVKDDDDDEIENNDDNIGNKNEQTFGMTEASDAKPLTDEKEDESLALAPVNLENIISDKTENLGNAEYNENNESSNENENDDNENNEEKAERPNKSSKPKKSKNSSPSKSKSQKVKSQREEEEIVQYTDEQLNESYNDFKKKKALPAYMMRDAVLDFARRQSLQFMVDEDYDMAYKNDLIVNDLLLEYSKDSGGYNADTITRSLESRIEVAQQQRAKSNEKYQQRIVEMKQHEQAKIQQLIDQQEEERKAFETGCQKPEFLQKFSKPSTKLLQIRKIQKSLALAHKFDEAKEVKAEADILQRSETVSAQRRAIEFIKTSFQQLVERQQQQLDCANENGNRKIRALEEQMNRENLANRNLLKQLETRLKETKTKKGSCLPPLNSNGSKKAPSKSTMKQLAKYKQSQNVSMLEVKLTNIQKIVGNVRPNPAITKPVKIV